LKRPREALPLFAESLEFKAEKPRDHAYRMAYCLAECGDVARAKDAITGALKRRLDKHEEWTARYYLGAVFAAAKEYDKALRELRFCEIHLDDSEGPITGLIDSLAYVCEKLGHLEDAARYKRATTNDSRKQPGGMPNS
jgi:tetratricopeptide (TPR) repeat protein